MKSRKIFLFAPLLCGLLFSVCSIGVLAAPSCGTTLATYRGVEAKSNGSNQATAQSCSGRGTYGLQYQCVEYIKRFYSQALSIDTTAWHYDAAQFFPNASKLGLIAYTNSQSSTAPAPDDIIVFLGKRDSLGHVAVVTGTTAGSITCIEQNWSKTGVTTLQLDSVNNNYTIRPRGTYKILGWLRAPPKPTTQKDIWTTSVYSYAPGASFPGGGLDDYELVVGGWGDLYYSLLQFDLTGRPKAVRSARLELFCFNQRGVGTTGILVDRITGSWDWKTQGTGRDFLRLWWADRPSSELWIPQALPPPVVGQWYSIDITDLYNGWQNGTYPNFGIQLRPTPGGNNQWAEFYSFDYADDPSLRPKLVIQVGSGGTFEEF